MTSLKPQLIRADTLDLQNPDSPSAKDHSKQPPYASPIPSNAAAPHQYQTLRGVEQHAVQEQMKGPGLRQPTRSRDYPEEPDFFDDPEEDDLQNSHLREGELEDRSVQDHDMGDVVMGNQMEDDDDDDGYDDELFDRLSSSPSIDDDEDIDLEFVYALRTFVAEVEGQAHATKGDTMVLLDDSNSYWWLVRVVKDSSIGYLPAEHIETPQERLARLNKRRNIDASATMLSDNAEKSKNPLKKAMRRRNAKTVQFSAPQYFEASDVDYSDEEEANEDLDSTGHIVQLGDEEQPDGDIQDTHMNDGSAMTGGRQEPVSDRVQVPHGQESAYVESSRRAQEESLSQEPVRDDLPEESGDKSKRNLARKTDSFLNDDGAETKKISLTPRLLQGDSDYSASQQHLEPRAKSSFESLDKLASADNDKAGEEKKKKEKKGMLGGFFKRKDKRARSNDNETDDARKPSGDVARGLPQLKKSSESLSQEGKPVKGDRTFQRQSSKLQKHPPSHLSPNSSPSKDNLQRGDPASVTSPVVQESSTPSTIQSPPPERIATEQRRSQEELPSVLPEPTPSPSGSRSIFTSMTNTMKPGTTPSQSQGDRDASTSPATDESRRQHDNASFSDSAKDNTVTSNEATTKPMPSRLDTAAAEARSERLSDSPIEVSPMAPWESQQSSAETQPPASLGDNISHSDRHSVSPISSPSSTAGSFAEGSESHDEEDGEINDARATSPRVDNTTPSTSRSTPTWSDASLRTYMDNDEDIRDLLIIVHDKSNVIPAGPEHPITGNLFYSEKGRLADMQANLDSMLTSWLARKNFTTSSR